MFYPKIIFHKYIPSFYIIFYTILLFFFNESYGQHTLVTKIKNIVPDSFKIKIPDTLDGWRYELLGNLNFSQASFSNWTSGGENSISTNGLVNVLVHYKKNQFLFETILNLNYGLANQFSTNKIIKTDDKINFTNKIGYTLNKYVDLLTFIDFKTQFSKGYSYPNDSTVISDFLSPAYLSVALGIDFKIFKKLKIFTSPVSLKYTIVNNTLLANQGAYGVRKAITNDNGQIVQNGEKTRSELGGFMRIIYRDEWFEKNKIILRSELELFSNYLNNPQNIDIQWDNVIQFKINSFLSTSLFTAIIYDDDISISRDTNGDGIEENLGPKIQFKQILGIGVYINL